MPPIHPARQISFEKVKKAIISLKRSKEKMSINKIAKKAGIERRTIYNNPEILEYCRQTVNLQQEVINGTEKNVDIIETKVKNSKQLLEERYLKVKGKLKDEQEKNAKLLYNMNAIVLKNSALKDRIGSLEVNLQKIRHEKVVGIKG